MRIPFVVGLTTGFASLASAQLSIDGKARGNGIAANPIEPLNRQDAACGEPFYVPNGIPTLGYGLVELIQITQ